MPVNLVGIIEGKLRKKMKILLPAAMKKKTKEKLFYIKKSLLYMYSWEKERQEKGGMKWKKI